MRKTMGYRYEHVKQCWQCAGYMNDCMVAPCEGEAACPEFTPAPVEAEDTGFTMREAQEMDKFQSTRPRGGRPNNCVRRVK